MFLKRNDAIIRMNSMGRDGIPFFFFTDFKGSKCWLSDLENTEALWQIGSKQNHSETNDAINHIDFRKDPKTLESFENQFLRVVKEINYGNSFLVNLTLQTPIQTNLSLTDIFAGSKARYKVLFKEEFVVFSPETFIEIYDNCIYAHPMKGTIDASIKNAAEVIIKDPKETAEHITIVDLIRNDISQFAQKVEVSRFRYIQELKTHEKNLLQVSSEIRGMLEDNWKVRLGSILFGLLPAGSISGAPKPSTMRIIEEIEDYDREFYTGVCGIFDGESLDSGVMIRFIQNNNGQLVFKSGGGITSFSTLKSEYQEVIDKVYVPVY